MRGVPVLLLIVLLAVPLGAADAAGPGACTSQGCVRTADRDGDGDLDWAAASLTFEKIVALNAIAENGTAHQQLAVTLEEYVERYPALYQESTANSTAGAGELLLLAYTGDEETGETSPVAQAHATLLVRHGLRALP